MNNVARSTRDNWSQTVDDMLTLSVCDTHDCREANTSLLLLDKQRNAVASISATL